MECERIYVVFGWWQSKPAIELFAELFALNSKDVNLNNLYKTGQIVQIRNKSYQLVKVAEGIIYQNVLKPDEDDDY